MAQSIRHSDVKKGCSFDLRETVADWPTPTIPGDFMTSSFDRLNFGYS